ARVRAAVPPAPQGVEGGGARQARHHLRPGSGPRGRAGPGKRASATALHQRGCRRGNPRLQRETLAELPRPLNRGSLHPFFVGLSPTLHISHRGGAALAPENTIAAFGLAVREHRTDMLEIDVQMTRDGALVVSHDPSLERCTNGSGEIASISRERLQSLDAGHSFTRDGGRTFPFRGRGVCIPLLEEALRAFPGMRWNIELKSSALGIEDAFAQLVRRE